jgi:hypothetical protein
MNVLIIPEDFRKDQYIVKPLIRRMLAEIGKPNANLRVCIRSQGRAWSGSPRCGACGCWCCAACRSRTAISSRSSRCRV